MPHTYGIVPDDDQVDEQMNKAINATDEGRTEGGTYEQGVEAALEWVLGMREEPPLAA